MKTIKNIFFFLLFMQSQIVFSQDSCIVAGDQTLAHYTDIFPDDTIYDCCYQPPDTFYLDLNQDNRIDFYIASWYGNFPSGSSGYTFIRAADNNKVLVNSTNNTIPDTLSNTDTICSSGVWKNEGYLIKYASYMSSPSTAYFYLQWNHLLNKNIGLKLINGTDSTYGWVQVYADYFALTNRAVIKNFGCGYIPPYVPPVIPPTTSEVIVFPNPTFNLVNIYLPTYSNYEIKLFNDIGEIVYQNIGNKKIIDLTPFPLGVYVLKIITNDKTFTEKIIKSKMQN